MRNRRLGRTGFSVSEISLGTVEIGMDYGIPVQGMPLRLSEAEAERFLQHALDVGINFLDTARVYGDSEAIIGRALRARRSEFFLVSKVLSFHQENLSSALLRDKVFASVYDSLQALQTDYLDILMIHSATLEAIQDGRVLEALQKLQSEGIVRAVGASVYGEEAALAAIQTGGYDCLQIAYNLLDRQPESRVFAAAEAGDVGLVARSVLLKGALTNRLSALPDTLQDLKNAVKQMWAAVRNEVDSLPELAYRYVLSQETPHTALVGTVESKELEQCIGFAERGPLPETLRRTIADMPMPDRFWLNPGNWPAL